MTAREFFYLVSSMRQAQKDYFKTRDRKILTYARALEGDVDREILRVKDIINDKQPVTTQSESTQSEVW